MIESDNTTSHKASAYDQDVRLTIPFYEEIQRQAIDMVHTIIPRVETWLDAGCGTGYLVELALPVFPQTRFILTDSSEAMLQQAKHRLKDAPNQRVEFLPPVPNEKLSLRSWRVAPQVVTSVLCHHYLQVQQRQDAVQACHKVLNEGGLFITFENIDTCTLKGANIALDRWKHYQSRQGRSLSIVEEHRGRFKTKYFPITINEHLSLLKLTGFKVVELFWLSHMQAGFYAIK